MTDSLTQLKVLVIDDFQPMHAMLRSFLNKMGIKRIDHASNAGETISLLSSKKYDIVLCDYNLGPGKNGMQILEEAKLRKYVGYSTIWIMVTAEKTMEMFMGAADTQPDDYVLKPINEKILETRIKKLIEKKQSFNTIEKAIHAGNYIGAISLCDKQIENKSKNTADLIRLKSDLLITIGDYTAAKALFEEILAERNIPWAKIGLGKVYFLSHDILRANEIFQEVLDENRMYLEAADWLAITFEALGDLKKTQQVLLNATRLSPNSSRRQKKLADAAHKNSHLDLAHTTYEKVIMLDEHSCLKSANTYTSLAKVLMDKNSPKEALKVLDRCRGEFKDDPEAKLHTTLVQSMVYRKMGHPEESMLAVKQAEKIMASLSGKVDTSVTMDMARALLQVGEKDKAYGFLENVIKNNHDKTAIIDQVKSMFEEEGFGTEGGDLIKKSIQEVIEINDRGVLLAREGKFDEGIKLLREASTQLPNNTLFLTNLCGMLIGLMLKNGKNDRLVYEARKNLEHVLRHDPTNKKCLEYMNALEQL